MQSRWFSHLKDAKEREDFKEYINNSQKVLDRLKELCYNMLTESELKTRNYDSPSWAYLQAHHNGKQETLEEIIKLITLERDK